MDDLDFSNLEPKQRPVVGPDKKRYFLVSASVDATVKYRNASVKAGKWDDVGGKLKVVGFNDLADQELVLVSNTLAESEGDAGEKVLLDRNGNPVLVPLARIKAWHGSVISRLYKASLELSPWLKQGVDDEIVPKGSSADGADSSNKQTS